MSKADGLFEQYKSLRLQGQSEKEAERNLIYGIQSLDLSSQLKLKQDFQNWEETRTLAELELEERSKLSNICLKMINCPVCESPNPCGLKNCQVCNTSLIPNELSPSEIPAADSLIDKDGKIITLILSSTNEEQQLLIQLPKNKEALRIGRSSPLSEIDVDLTEFGAVETGISRLHALLIYDSKNESIYLSDMKSTNGTFVNGIRLVPNTSVRIYNNDELCFGRLKLQMSLHELKK